MPIFTPDTIRTFEKLKDRKWFDLMHVHPCMAYDVELMKSAAVLSKTKIYVERFAINPTMHDVVTKGIVAPHDDLDTLRARFLAAYIAAFEHQGEIHRQFNEIEMDRHLEHQQPPTSGRHFAFV